MRERQRTGTGGGSLETQAPFSSAAFKLPLVNTLAPIGGYGPATFTRTTTATYFDNEGMLKEVRAGAARFTGARRVANLSQSTEYLSTWTTTNSNIVDSGFTGPNGSPVYTFSPITTAAAYLYNATISALVVGRTYVISCYVKKVDNKDFGLYIGNSIGTATYDLDAVSYSLSGGATAGGIASVGNGFFRVWMAGVCSTSFASNHGIYKFISVAGASYYVCGMQVEDVTGQSDQTPSEYVSYGATPPNLFTYTEDLTNSIYFNTNTTITRNSIANPIDGRINAIKVEAASAAVTSFNYRANGVASASGMSFSIYIKKGSGATDANKFYLQNATTVTNLVNCIVDFDAGTTTAGTLTPVGDGWYKLVASAASGFSNGDDVKCYFGFLGSSETANEFCYIYGPTLVKGVSDPSYTPVGAAYDPHGSGVDGVKYFTTNKDGSNILPRVLKGYLTEGAAINSLLYSRDLTNAAWVKSNMSTALTSTGIDGQTNTATRLTATADDGTCLQTIIKSAASRSFSAYVKRITGTGTISITRDNGTTWTDITNNLLKTAYARVYIEDTSVVDPTCGFKITTNTDAIDVDYCQDEAGAVASNPIPTTTVAVTRNQDFLSYLMAGNISPTSSTALVDFSYNERNNVLVLSEYCLSLGSNGRIVYCNNFVGGNTTYIYDGTTSVSKNSGALRTFGNLVKCCSSWGANLRIVNGGSFSVTSGSFDGLMDNSGILYIGSSSGTATGKLYGNVKGIYTWLSELTDAQMIQVVNS